MPGHWRKRYEKLDRPDPILPGWLWVLLFFVAGAALLITLGCTSQPQHPHCTEDYRYLVPGPSGWEECSPQVP